MGPRKKWRIRGWRIRGGDFIKKKCYTGPKICDELVGRGGGTMTYLCVILFIVEPWNLSGGLMGSIPLVCLSVRLFMCLILCVICHEFAQSVAHCSTNFTFLGLFVAFFLLVFLSLDLYTNEYYWYNQFWEVNVVKKCAGCNYVLQTLFLWIFSNFATNSEKFGIFWSFWGLFA